MSCNNQFTPSNGGVNDTKGAKMNRHNQPTPYSDIINRDILFEKEVQKVAGRLPTAEEITAETKQGEKK